MKRSARLSSRVQRYPLIDFLAQQEINPVVTNLRVFVEWVFGVALLQNGQRWARVESLHALTPIQRFLVSFARVLWRVVLNSSLRYAVVIFEELLQDQQ